MKNLFDLFDFTSFLAWTFFNFLACCGSQSFGAAAPFRKKFKKTLILQPLLFVENFNKLKTFNDSISHEFFPKFKITEIIFQKNFSLNFPPFFLQNPLHRLMNPSKKDKSVRPIYLTPNYQVCLHFLKIYLFTNSFTSLSKKNCFSFFSYCFQWQRIE